MNREKYEAIVAYFETAQDLRIYNEGLEKTMRNSSG